MFLSHGDEAKELLENVIFRANIGLNFTSQISFRPKLSEEKPRKFNLTQMAFKEMLTIVVRGSSIQMFRAV
jgi:hypothetical protein